MKKPRYLTKSKFKLGMECETKLYYVDKPEYASSKIDNSFLESLAKGGHQVGELAKLQYPGGVQVLSKDYDEAEKETQRLLQQENIVIYEAAIKFENLFVRADILIKTGDVIQLIEVKAKSYQSDAGNQLLSTKDYIYADWLPYLYDIAFQNHVLVSKFPDYKIEPYLLLVDKAAECVDQMLNQKFEIIKKDSQVEVLTSIKPSALKSKLLTAVSVINEINLIYSGLHIKDYAGPSFKEKIKLMSDKYLADEKITAVPSSTCSKCEYRCKDSDLSKGQISGFKECWTEALGWQADDFSERPVLDVWGLRSKTELIVEGKAKISSLVESDIAPKPNKKSGLSASERKWLQVKKYQDGDSRPYIDFSGMKNEFSKWKYPLHFIDFETSAPAIPFTSGRKPYEGICFQFSHHIVYESGRVEHAGQYLNVEAGEFPNFDFIRKLKDQLDSDKGTIFRYGTHENTYLNLIYNQLKNYDGEIEDKEELCAFIKSISKSTTKSKEKWQGERCMVDMQVLVKRYYYDPGMVGSNSIKDVLPAIMNSSDYIKNKYSKPDYGSDIGIPSFNFKDFQWVSLIDGVVVDPYSKLPQLFSGVSQKDIDNLLSDTDELKNGGAALAAYAKLQSTKMTAYEREELSVALLKYCELDTLAMVMIFEGWREMLKAKLETQAVA